MRIFFKVRCRIPVPHIYLCNSHAHKVYPTPVIFSHKRISDKLHANYADYISTLHKLTNLQHVQEYLEIITFSIGIII